MPSQPSGDDVDAGDVGDANPVGSADDPGAPMDESSDEATQDSPSYSPVVSQVSPVDSAGQAPASGQSEPLDC